MKQEIFWKELVTTPEEEILLQAIRDGGVGKSLSEEALNEFSVGCEKHFTVPTRAGDTMVHYYRPEDNGEVYPLFINIHGGGYVKGMRDQDVVFCRNICSRSGWAVMDIDYTPAPAMRYPGQVYACYDAMQYFAGHSAELGIDPGKIVVAGHSSGGNLTAGMMLLAMDNHTFLPAMQILDYACLDNKTSAYNRRNGDANPRIPAWKGDFYQKCYVDREDAEEIYCSPVFADDEHLAKMPPTVLIYCDNDGFCDETEAFAQRLITQGVTVTAKRFYHSNHGFLIQRKGEYQEAEHMILSALMSLNMTFGNPKKG